MPALSQCPDCGDCLRPGEALCPNCGIELLDYDEEDDAWEPDTNGPNWGVP